jgi:redox-regulated HSP33 family molecular chaperone
MERWCYEAKTALEFLIRSFPEDDMKHKPARDSFVETVKHLTELSVVLVKEEHEGLQAAKEPGAECPCASCKAERFLEVLTNMSREQLLEIIATESGIDLEKSTACTKAVANDTDESAPVIQHQ